MLIRRNIKRYLLFIIFLIPSNALTMEHSYEELQSIHFNAGLKALAEKNYLEANAYILKANSVSVLTSFHLQKILENFDVQYFADELPTKVELCKICAEMEKFVCEFFTKEIVKLYKDAAKLPDSQSKINLERLIRNGFAGEPNFFLKKFRILGAVFEADQELITIKTDNLPNELTATKFNGKKSDHYLISLTDYCKHFEQITGRAAHVYRMKNSKCIIYYHPEAIRISLGKGQGEFLHILLENESFCTYLYAAQTFWFWALDPSRLKSTE